MSFLPDFSRRGFIRLAAAAPLLGQIAAKNVLTSAATALGKDPRQNVYARLGVKTVINCRGTWTYLSGSLEFPEVRLAQVEAAQHFVNMLELQRAVGRRVSQLTGAESGIVTSGAAGAMAAATAGCMAGTNDKYIWQLPDTTGLKHEVIMVGGRSAFDSAIRLTGAKLVLTYSPKELVNAINENTAMIYTTDLGNKLQREVSIAKDHKIPMLLDDAAGIPPADNAKLYARMGIDLYCFSGGKGLCGPQCSGLLLGRKDLAEDGREETVRRVERPRGSHSKTGGDRTRRQDGDLHSRRWEPLSNAQDFLGSAGLGIQYLRLCPGAASRGSSHRSS